MLVGPAGSTPCLARQGHVAKDENPGLPADMPGLLGEPLLRRGAVGAVPGPSPAGEGLCGGSWP